MNTRELGRWRKLWTKPSPSWEMLPAGARGLGDELLRYCDDQGRLPRMGLEPWQAASRILRAHVSERRWVQAMLERLVADGFVRVEPDALVIRNFATAQAAVTESGERMREKRARDAEATDGRPADDVGATGERLANDRRTTGARRRRGATPRDHDGGGVTVTPSEEISSEKKRSSPLTPLPGGEGAEGESTPTDPTPVVECATVERVTAPGVLTPRDRDAVAEVLRVEGAGRVETRAVAQSWVELLRLCEGAGYTLADLAAVGRYLAAGVPWVRPKRVTIGYLAGGKTPGSILEQLVSEANERERAAATRRVATETQAPVEEPHEDSPPATPEQFANVRAMLARVKAERPAPLRLLAGGADGA